MMNQRHYDDEALIALMESNRDGSDAHLPSCGTCSEKLDSVKLVAGALKDEAVWDTRPLSEEPVRSTIANLRAFAGRMAGEDAQAGIYVRELLDGPRASWKQKLESHPEYRTAGMVRKLIAAASRAVDTMPPDAVETATIAAEIAEGLGANPMAAGQLDQLRGAARRERAYALYYIGRFSDALLDADRADEHFANCALADYEHARVGIVRALVFRALERYTAGLQAARDSARVFERFDDTDRLASARMAEVHLLFSLRDFDQAVAILVEQEGLLRSSGHVETHARILPNLGYAKWQQGNVVEALRYYDASSQLMASIGIETEALRTRWNVAAMLADGGYHAEALTRLRVVASQFERLGMTSEAAMAGLGIAELLLADGKFAEIDEICGRAMRSFEAAGVSYTAKALTALAYMREASRNRIATPKLVRHVREYIRRLPVEENLLFAPI